MPSEQVREFTVGDTRIIPSSHLYQADGTPLDLSVIVGVTVQFRMVRASDGLVKVNDAPASIITPSPAQVAYTWTAPDVNLIGDFWAWFIVTDGSGRTEHYPTGRLFKIQIRSRV